MDLAQEKAAFSWLISLPIEDFGFATGLTEGFNQTLQTALIKVVNDSQDDWDEHLFSVLFTY